MNVEVIRANSIEEAIQMIASTMICKDCECEKQSAPAAKTGEVLVNLDYFVNEIARKKGWKLERAAGWINSIADLNPGAALNILLREIAVCLDRKYEDHIENSEKIYCVSMLDGRIHEVCKAHIKNYRNFAAFRTIEDAKYACNILRNQLKDMFKSNAKRK